MKSIDLVIKYYKTSGLEIPQPIQELIDEITKLSPCEQEGYRKEIERLKGMFKGQRLMTEVKNIEMERLKKEKEWLINELIPIFLREYHKVNKTFLDDEETKTLIIATMQQALKDKS